MVNYSEIPLRHGERYSRREIRQGTVTAYSTDIEIMLSLGIDTEDETLQGILKNLRRTSKFPDDWEPLNI